MTDFYSNRRWVRARAFHLAEEPLCRMCAAEGTVTSATVVDHIVPRAVAPDRAFDGANLQSLCKRHHDARKQQQESRGYHSEVDADGYPVDPAHPANRDQGAG